MLIQSLLHGISLGIPSLFTLIKMSALNFFCRLQMLATTKSCHVALRCICVVFDIYDCYYQMAVCYSLHLFEIVYQGFLKVHTVAGIL